MFNGYNICYESKEDAVNGQHNLYVIIIEL